MLKLGLLLVLGVAAGQPFRQHFSSPYSVFKSKFMDHSSFQQPFSRTYAKPLSYAYMSEPMAQVRMAGYPMDMEMHAKPYHGFHHDQKMVGEQFFKHPGHDHDEDELEEAPYTMIQDFGPYELREYPSANYACVKSEVDTAADPMAGLENVNPYVLMSSKRWKKQPSSIMFMELFKYISGVNKEGNEIEMTRPVSTHHSIKKKQFGGDLEVQEMCFYVPAEHQANPPQPLENSPVYIFKRPTMRVYVLRFGGFALSSDTWQKNHDLLENLLIGKPHHDTEYYTNGYDSPMTLFNRRNEVWIQDLEAGAPVIAAVVAEVDEDEEDEPVAEPEHVLPAEEKKQKKTKKE